MTKQATPTIKIPPAVAPDGVASITALLQAGINKHMILRQCSAGGTWRRLLPGVVMFSRQRPTRRQRLRAALAWAGEDAVISGNDALRALGVHLPVTPEIRLLVPAKHRLTVKDFIVVERTTRMPVPVTRDGMPFAPPARAVLDAARNAGDPRHAHALLAAVADRQLCTRTELVRELDAGNQRGSATVRALLQKDARTVSRRAA